MVEGESGGFEAGGEGSFAAGEFPGEFAEGGFHEEGGDRDDGRAVEGGGQVVGELLVGDRGGEGDVDRAADGLVFGDEADGAEPVGEGDDWEVLRAGAEATTDAQPEGE